MSTLSPIEKPADLQSSLPRILLVGIAGLLLVVLEGALAIWDVFYAAVPLTTLAFIFYLRLNFPYLLPLVTVFLMGLFGELMFADMLGSRSTALLLVAVMTSFRSASLQHSEFLDLWSNFCLIVLLYMGVRLAVFIAYYFTIPEWQPLFFQAGVTMFMFPLFFVILASLSTMMGQIFGVDTD